MLSTAHEGDGMDQVERTAETHRRGHGPHRLNALAGGIVAIAMTLLALEIRIPDVEDRAAFLDVLPSVLVGLGVFTAAFFITGGYWLGHHRVMAMVHTVDMGALRKSLAGVAALPVAMNLIFGAGQFPETIAVTAGLLALTSVLSSWFYAHVLRPEFSDVDAASRRMFIVQPPVNVGLSAARLTAAWAALFWFVPRFNRPMSAWVVRRLR